MFNKIKQQANKLMKGGKKGFTLIEVIVVLVIIAILAAIAIPSLTGYIDKAKEKAITSEARTALTAVQEMVSDEYGQGVADPLNGASSTFFKGDGTLETAGVTEVQKLTGMSNVTATSITGLNTTGTAVSTMTYKNSAYQAVYASGAWTVTKLP